MSITNPQTPNEWIQYRQEQNKLGAQQAIRDQNAADQKAFQQASVAPTYNYYTPPTNPTNTQGSPITQDQWVAAGGLLQASGKNSVSASQMSNGSYLDTSNLSPQQAYAAQLMDEVKNGKRTNESAMSVLSGMGLNQYGNALPATYLNAQINQYGLQSTPSSTQSTSGGGGTGTSTSTTPPALGYGGADYNKLNATGQKAMIDNWTNITSSPANLQAEIARTNGVIAEKQKQGQDVTEQLAHLAKLQAAGASMQGGSGGGAGSGNGMTLDTSNPQQLFSDYNQGVVNYGNAATNPSDPYWDSIRALADSLGSSEYTQRKSAMENLLSQLTGNQQADLQALQGAQANAENKISDQTFQDWLAARQNLSNRGLAGTGSGFQNDADVRLQMNKQNALGDLYNTVAQQLAKTNANYGEKLANAQQSLSGLNLNSLQQSQFQSMFKDTSANLLDMVKTYAGLAGKQMPYAQTSTSDLLKTQLGYDKLSQQDKQFYDKLGQDYNLDMTKMMGVDANGNPTLDTQKFIADVKLRQANLDEKIRNNRVTASISSNNAMIKASADAAKLMAQIDNNQAKLKQAATSMASDNLNTYNKQQLDALISISDQRGAAAKQLADMIGQYNDHKQSIPDDIQKMYNNAISDYQASISATEAYRLSMNPATTSTPSSGGTSMQDAINASRR